MNEYDLALTPTDALKEELQKRYDIGVVLLARGRTSETGDLEFRVWGDTFQGLGMLRAVQVKMERDAAEMFEDDCECEHGHGDAPS